MNNSLLEQLDKTVLSIMHEHEFDSTRERMEELEEIEKVRSLSEQERMQYEKCRMIFLDNLNIIRFAVYQGYIKSFAETFTAGDDSKIGKAASILERQGLPVMAIKRALKIKDLDFEY